VLLRANTQLAADIHKECSCIRELNCRFSMFNNFLVLFLKPNSMFFYDFILTVFVPSI